MHAGLILLTLASVLLIIIMVTCFICFVRSRRKEDEELMEQVQYTNHQRQQLNQQQQQQQQQQQMTPQRQPTLSPSPSDQNMSMINDINIRHQQQQMNQQMSQQQQQQQAMQEQYQRSAYAQASASPYHNPSMLSASGGGPQGTSGSPRGCDNRQVSTDITQQINSAIIGSSEAEFQNDFIQVFPMYQIAPQPEKNTTPYLT